MKKAEEDLESQLKQREDYEVDYEKAIEEEKVIIAERIEAHLNKLEVEIVKTK